MKDYEGSIEKLRKDAAEAALIRDLATDQAKREIFNRLHEHLNRLADEIERALSGHKTASFMFRCPRYETCVVVPFSPDPASDPNTYEYVACPACSRSHLLNKSTGMLLGVPVEKVFIANSS
jgi:hypothetical protein